MLFKLYTVGYLSQLFREGGEEFLIGKSVIIVEKFEDQIVRAAIESILDSIADYGIEK
ncbi:MAG: hypothetical protein ABW047_03950 [Nitrospiraceae bacterium]